jgi:hypothetical protein
MDHLHVHSFSCTFFLRFMNPVLCFFALFWYRVSLDNILFVCSSCAWRRRNGDDMKKTSKNCVKSGVPPAVEILYKRLNLHKPLSLYNMALNSKMSFFALSSSMVYLQVGKVSMVLVRDVRDITLHLDLADFAVRSSVPYINLSIIPSFFDKSFLPYKYLHSCMSRRGLLKI